MNLSTTFRTSPVNRYEIRRTHALGCVSVFDIALGDVIAQFFEPVWDGNAPFDSQMNGANTDARLFVAAKLAQLDPQETVNR